MQWFTDFMQRWRLARDERRHQYDLHKVPHDWLLSGVGIGSKNELSDAGLTNLWGTLDEVRAKLAAWYPRGSVIHIDEVHYIITYRVS